MKVVFLPASKSDLLSIATYIARDNRRRAQSFVQDLRQTCKELGELPQAWPLLPRYKSTGIRRRVHGNYLIFYRIRAKRIEIIHILHGAMDYEAVLFPEG